MKTKILATLLVLSFSLPLPPNSGADGSKTLIINELMYNPLGTELEGEWIELFNVGDDTNVKDWIITDRDGATFTFPDILVPTHYFVLIYIKTGNITYQPNTTILYMNRTWSMLNNGGDDLLLVDSQGTAIDYVNYGSGSAVDYPIFPLNWTGTNKTVSEGFSYALMPDGEDLDSDENWLQNAPSPGTFNSIDEGHGILIAEVYYNAHRDDEYIKLYNPLNEEINLTSWTLADLEGTIFFPEGSILQPKDEIIIAENSTSFSEDTLLEADYRFLSGDATPMVVQGVFKLKNDGDELILRNKAGKVVDAFCYGASNYSGEGWLGESAKALYEGKIAKRALLEGAFLDTNTSDDWNSVREYGIGQSSFQVKTFLDVANMTAFTSPDSSYETIAKAIDSAESTIHISLYKLTSWPLAQHLLDALERGIEMRILLEGAPVQGIEDEQKYIMKVIAEKGGQLELMIHNPSADVYQRYPYLHAKYAIIDSTISIVTSENWGPTGLPKNNTYGNRGWGIIIENEKLADELLEIFYEDWNPSRMDILPYSSEKYPIPLEYTPSAIDPSGSYEAPFKPLETNGYYATTPILSPDTSLDEDAVIGMIRSAETSIFVEQFYIVQEWTNNRTNPYVEEVVEAARRGVEVKVLLDDSEYNVEPDDIDNDDVVASLNNLAEEEGLNLKAKLFNSSAHGILKIHNKGLIVDGKKILISSINWNCNSITNNREIGIIVEDEAIGEYFAKVFLHDWKDDVRAPIAIGCDDITVFIGEEVIFDGGGSYDANPVEYRWDFDGDKTVDSTMAISKFIYDEPGIYHAELNVSDSSGNYNVSSCTVEVIAEKMEDSNNAWSWLFYIVLISIAVFIVYYARKLSRKQK